MFKWGLTPVSLRYWLPSSDTSVIHLPPVAFNASCFWHLCHLLLFEFLFISFLFPSFLDFFRCAPSFQSLDIRSALKILRSLFSWVFISTISTGSLLCLAFLKQFAYENIFFLPKISCLFPMKKEIVLLSLPKKILEFDQRILDDFNFELDFLFK